MSRPIPYRITRNDRLPFEWWDCGWPTSPKHRHLDLSKLRPNLGRGLRGYRPPHVQLHKLKPSRKIYIRFSSVNKIRGHARRVRKLVSNTKRGSLQFQGFALVD